MRCLCVCHVRATLFDRIQHLLLEAGKTHVKRGAKTSLGWELYSHNNIALHRHDANHASDISSGISPSCSVGTASSLGPSLSESSGSKQSFVTGLR